MGWVGLTSKTTAAYLRPLGVSDKYINELIEGSVRVNYAQNADFIHALEGACSNADGNAVGVAGGNFKIFEQFLSRSGANLKLKTTVCLFTPTFFSLTKLLQVKSIFPALIPSRGWNVLSSKGLENYKAVILAAPFHQTGIITPPSISSKVPQQPYVHLHVTLVATPSRYPNATYFGLPAGSPVPSYMITTAHGAGKPEFNSVSYQGVGRPGESVHKIFSNQQMSDKWLKMMFGQVTWVQRKEVCDSRNWRRKID